MAVLIRPPTPPSDGPEGKRRQEKGMYREKRHGPESSLFPFFRVTVEDSINLHHLLRIGENTHAHSPPT